MLRCSCIFVCKSASIGLFKMHFQNFLGAAAALIVTATASLVTTRSYTAPSFRAASELKNVSTYHELTRMRSPVRQPRGAYHNGLSSRSGGYGLSPTTSFGNVRADEPPWRIIVSELTTLESRLLYPNQSWRPNFRRTS